MKLFTEQMRIAILKSACFWCEVIGSVSISYNEIETYECLKTGGEFCRIYNQSMCHSLIDLLLIICYLYLEVLSPSFKPDRIIASLDGLTIVPLSLHFVFPFIPISFYSQQLQNSHKQLRSSPFLQHEFQEHFGFSKHPMWYLVNV